jgi:hypothetical protein
MYKIQREKDIIKIGNKICDDFLAKIDKLHENLFIQMNKSL